MTSGLYQVVRLRVLNLRLRSEPFGEDLGIVLRRIAEQRDVSGPLERPGRRPRAERRQGAILFDDGHPFAKLDQHFARDVRKLLARSLGVGQGANRRHQQAMRNRRSLLLCDWACTVRQQDENECTGTAGALTALHHLDAPIQRGIGSICRPRAGKAEAPVTPWAARPTTWLRFLSNRSRRGHCRASERCAGRRSAGCSDRNPPALEVLDAAGRQRVKRFFMGGEALRESAQPVEEQPGTRRPTFHSWQCAPRARRHRRKAASGARLETDDTADRTSRLTQAKLSTSNRNTAIPGLEASTGVASEHPSLKCNREVALVWRPPVE